MILAVPVGAYRRLEVAGELKKIEEEILTKDIPALRARVDNKELIQAKDAVRHPKEERDRCYLCGDEVTICYRKRDKAHYFRHLTPENNKCIGDPANPAGAKQRWK